jgi:hypothetical protein
MNQRNILVATGACCFLLFVLVNVPARVIGSLLPNDTVVIAGTSGTLWNGAAQSVQAEGIQLREVTWDLHPLSLLLGRVSVSLDAKWSDGFIRGDIAAGIGGSLKLRDVQVAGSLAPILGRLNLPAAGGEVALDLQVADIDDLWPTQLIATLRVGRVPLSMIGVSGGVTGSYTLEFDVTEIGEDGSIPGVLSDGGGPLEILGELRLTPPTNYTIDARIKARLDAPAELAQGLSLAGPKLPDGSHSFQMTGSL